MKIIIFVHTKYTMDLIKKEITNGLGFKSVFLVDSEGLRQGESFIYAPDGNLVESCFYVNDYKNGEYKSWWENGNPSHFTYYSNPFTFHGVNVTWWENGIMSSRGQFINGKHHGVHEEWTEEGILWQLINYQYGAKEGCHNEWYFNGKSKIKATYKNGLKENMYSEWNEDGNLTFQGIFTSGVLQHQFK
jgi:antitoxin component YwqK of YwqJK toxin-antitoxin module